ncbi:helix-turn-helix transcriptional regulator [Dyadobacter chenwenxiniae]|uniref:Helix-turn-helix transcriptional regulator n=1 Tax=Dyadobacter chenwenxiniae TaxID=2906456 RepID=A0A9X1THF4_9BACT|nr:helix-turn-helix domain-containing protein [Dyadobacter chenwenxiniae]MCF0064720.1 helix-turn-helix transcriptional regulator [Dyadobacter chenwenxiniae]UON84226.1 helix-turn-helix transcriptional regulator [Dyadobacter chenwenxiniae]
MFHKETNLVSISNLLLLGNNTETGNIMVTKGNNQNDFKNCPITATMEVIGGKWKPLILYNLTLGTRRFGELSVRIPAISRKVLTEQLKELERDGLVIRQQFKEMPPRVEYSLTEKSNSLVAVFKEIAKWGNQNLLINQE